MAGEGCPNCTGIAPAANKQRKNFLNTIIMIEDIFIKESDGIRIHAFDYSAQWGSTEGNGPLFYNVSVEADNWTKKDWNRFANAIDENIKLVKATPSSYDPDEIEALTTLKKWADLNYSKAKEYPTTKRGFIPGPNTDPSSPKPVFTEPCHRNSKGAWQN